MVISPGSVLTVMGHPDDAELWAGGARPATQGQGLAALPKV